MFALNKNIIFYLLYKKFAIFKLIFYKNQKYKIQNFVFKKNLNYNLYSYF